MSNPQADFLDSIIETTEPEATENSTVEAPENDAEASSDWPQKVTLPAGERPDGALTITEFANLVNKEAIRAKVAELIAEGVDPTDAAIASTSEQTGLTSFYQAIKGQRNPMPHYVVTSDAEGEEKTRILVPQAEALEWWQNRPTRGGGSGPRGSEEDQASRLIRAGKKVSQLKAAEARLEKVQTQVNTIREQLNKYETLIAPSTLDDAVKAAEEAAEADEAEKAIGDDE